MTWYSLVFLATLAVFFGLNALATIARIGQERKPITTELAVATTLTAGLFITALVTVMVKN